MKGVSFFLFVCFWSTLVLLFDVLMGRSLWNQFASGNYPSASGQITQSEVTQHRSSKGGTTYGVDIRYRYMVNDRSFDGTRFRYNAGSSSDSGWAVKAVAGHPVGSQTRVYYNPQNPQDALLSPGADGSDLMMALFLMPFNMVMLGLWTGVGGWLRERIFKPLAGGVRIITEGPRTSIRLPEYGALIWCLVAVGGLSFVSIFILGFESGFHPSLLAASLVLFLVAAAGAGAYGWQWRKIHSGDDDLILDEEVQTMELPETCGRKNRVTFAFSEIENLTLEVIEHHSRKVTTVRCWSRGWCPRYSVWIRLAACLSGEGSGVATHPQTSLVSSGQGSPRRSALMRLRTAAAATLECQARTSITELREPWSLGTFF